MAFVYPNLILREADGLQLPTGVLDGKGVASTKEGIQLGRSERHAWKPERLLPIQRVHATSSHSIARRNGPKGGKRPGGQRFYRLMERPRAMEVRVRSLAREMHPGNIAGSVSPARSGYSPGGKVK